MSAKNMFYPEGKEFSVAEDRAFAREELVYNVTEDILVALEDMDVNKKELARRLGRSGSYVTQILSGARNMTLGSLSDICFALGIKPKVNINNKAVMKTLELNAAKDLTKKIDYRFNNWAEHIENDWTTTIVESFHEKRVQLTHKTENVVNLKDHKNQMQWKAIA